MATSGSYNYSATALSIVTEALEFNGVSHSGQAITADDMTTCLRSLNIMSKQWSGNFDFAPGLKAFSRKTGYLFLQDGQGRYTLGPSGDNASLSYKTTTMRIAGIATNTTLEVTSTTGMTAADNIGIELNSGTIFWTTISSVTDSDTLVIPATGLTSASAIGNRIFTYTTKLIRPLYMETVSVRDVDGNDSGLAEMTRNHYEAIYVKSTESSPSKYLYENTLTDGTFTLDTYPNNIRNVVRMVFMATAEDYDTQTDDISYPQEWFLPLAVGLAKITAPKFGQTWSVDKEDIYKNALMMARTSYAETSEDYFQPGID